MAQKNPGKKPNWQNLLFVLLLLLIPVQLLLSIGHNSVYADEPYHITSGYSKLKTMDYRLFPEQGPLIPVISAFPLLFMNVSFPFDDSSWKVKDMDVLMPKFLFEYNKDPYLLVFWSRIPMILLSIILGCYVYNWAKELFGKRAGLVALFLYTFSTDMLAHAQISSSDFGLAVFAFIAVYHFWRYLKEPSPKNLIISGLTLGLAQLTKFSAIFLLPIFFVVLMVAFISKNDKRYIEHAPYLTFKRLDSKFFQKAASLVTSFVFILLITYLVICVAYKFEGMGKPIAASIREDVHLDKALFPLEKLTGSNPMLRFALEKVPSPLPYYYARGLGFSFYFAKSIEPSLVLGDHRGTKPYFFLLMFLLKTQIALFIMLAICLIFYGRLRKGAVDEAAIIVPFLLFHLAFCFTTKQFGYRYVVQAIPFLFVFVSRLANLRLDNRAVKTLFCISMILLASWYIYASVSIAPHYLSYFNEFIGPKNAYKLVVDSNIDWGQDLFYLRDYVKANGIGSIKTAYFGFPTLNNYPFPGNYYEIPAEELSCGRTEGLIAISVTRLMGEQDCYGWLLNEKPIARIGYTMMVYNITPDYIPSTS